MPAGVLPTYPFEDDVIGLNHENKYSSASEQKASGQQKEDTFKGEYRIELTSFFTVFCSPHFLQINSLNTRA